MRRPVLTPLLMVALLTVAPAFAANKEDLAKAKQDIESAKERKSELAQENKKLADELAVLQQQLVKAAEIVQKGEAELSVAEERLRVLDGQFAAKDKALENSKARLAALVDVALRLSRTPPEAMVLMPEDSEKTMKASRALAMATASIREETEALRLQLEELALLKQKVGLQRDVLQTRKNVYDREQKTLSAKLGERRQLQQQLGRKEQEEAEKIARLARQAEDMEGLVGRIEKAIEGKRAGKTSLEMTSEAPAGQRGKIRSFVAAKGRIRPPLAGQVIRQFGEAAGRNETSKGMVIMARPHAQVTAPYDGEVVFAGVFLNYGRMVILRHSDHFHSLLAGLQDIDTNAGEFLLEGEPIGAMGEGEEGARLYLELRKNNQPIDPSPWIK